MSHPNDNPTASSETDALIKADAHNGIDGYMSEMAYDRMADHALELERERDEARALAEMYRDSDARRDDWPKDRLPWEEAQ